MANNEELNDAFDARTDSWRTSNVDPYAVEPVPQDAPMLDLPGIEPEEESPFLNVEAREFDISKSAGKDDADNVNQTFEEVSKSFGALKDAIEQGRELKAREREHDALVEQIDADKEELADRDNILVNYASMAAEQDNRISLSNQQREQLRAEIAQASQKLQEVQGEYDSLRAYHAQTIAPLESELGRATAAADQAKSDERSRKSEFNAAESELSKAAEDRINIAQAKFNQVNAAYNEAKARTELAKDQLNEAQKAYDVKRRQFDSEEAPLEKVIDDLENRISGLKTQVSEIEASLDRLVDRRQYIEDVYRNPDDTEELRVEVADNEATERKMTEETDELRELLAQSKEQSKKAKVTIGIVVAAIILIIILIVFLMTR